MRLKSYLRGIGIGMIVTAAILHFTFAKAGASMTDEQIIAKAKELGMIENTLLINSASVNDADISDADISMKESAKNTEKETVTISSPGSSSASKTDSNDKESSVNNVSDNSLSDNNATDDSTSDNSVSEESTLAEPKRGTTLNPEDFKEDSNANEDNKDNVADNKDHNNTATEDGSKYRTDGNKDTVEYKTITINGGDGSYAVAKKVAEAGIVKSAAELDAFLCENNYDKTLVTGKHRIPVDASYKEIAVILTSAASQ